MKKLIHALIGALVISICAASTAVAQQGELDPQFPSDALHAAKDAALDPTTWAPATLWYISTRLDWDSSQVFFRNGFVEKSGFYTVSGLPNDTPLGFEAGKRKILKTALINAQISFANNWTNHMFEQVLIRKYPEHQKLIKVLSVVERISFASIQVYALGTMVHFDQWEQNRQLAQQLGIH